MAEKEKSKFVIKEVAKNSWHIFKENAGFFIAITLIAWIVSVIPSYIANSLEKNFPITSFLFGIIGIILSIVTDIGLIKIAVQSVDKAKRKIADLFNYYFLFFKYIGGLILYITIVLTGFLLLIIPGIIWGIQFQFFSYLIIDEKLNPLEALKKSSKITKGEKWHLFVFNISMLMINLLGALALGIGLVITVPITLLATASVYRKLNPK